MSESQKKVFRFKFSNELLELMKEFSQIHQHDTKDNFADNWSLFLDKNKDFIEIEERRLKESGFVGSINDKMYKSVKYYYSKKGYGGGGGECGDGSVKKKVERKKYVSVGYDVLVMMNTHISENIKKEDYKPDKGFDEFINNIDNIEKDSDEFKRYKKAYKNMYYRFSIPS